MQATLTPPAQKPRILPFDTVIGAEVAGVDVGAGVTPQMCEAILEALDTRSVVVLRNQRFTPAQHVQLAAGIGEVLPLFYPQYTLKEEPNVALISNKKVDGRAIGIEDAGMLWHTDASFKKQPEMYSVLYGLEIPERDGKRIGDTAFASAIHAYKSLPKELRERLVGMTATHSFEHHVAKKAAKGQMKRDPLTPEQKAKLPDISQPVVCAHPRTGEPCLYVSEGHTKCIDGLPQAESDALLELLWNHIKEPRFQYRHQWTPNDVVIWDNRAVQHLAIFDYEGLTRHMNRVGTSGPPTVAWRPA
ncbi:TauD/TfdA dioxygenase family protein [Ramlibacter sp.]|uniref:TauD/TfdA dioxygenase family protein n=1 Tax=Ramlibacter sp. TaxID=1917967 RepID=UPI003D0C3213